jgi:translocator assembly and maintenance protein 41
MLDLIFAVADPLAWHTANLARNPSHYSLIARALGARGVCALQERAAHIYYNATWPRLKYGVISLRRLHDDLTQWDTLYVAGRMHKPVRCLHARLAAAPHLPASTASAPSDNGLGGDDRFASVAHVVAVARSNLRAAFGAALLTLPAAFTDRELFAAIAALSYAGDVRFRLGLENPNKVANLVAPHMAAFRALYYPFIARHLRVSSSSSSSSSASSPPSLLSHAFARFPRSAHAMPAASSAYARWSSGLCNSPLLNDDIDPPSTVDHHAIGADAQILPVPLQRTIAAANSGTAALFPWSLSTLQDQPHVESPGIPPGSDSAGQTDAPWYLQVRQHEQFTLVALSSKIPS